VALCLNIPGWRALALEHLVLDLNGTLARDGVVAPEVRQAVLGLSEILTCHLLTADTFGTAATIFGRGVNLHVIGPGDEAGQKLAFVRRLGADGVAAVGNGANDAPMLLAAVVGVCVVGPEGAYGQAVRAADVITTGPLEALGLFSRPDRLRATLRR